MRPSLPSQDQGCHRERVPPARLKWLTGLDGPVGTPPGLDGPVGTPPGLDGPVGTPPGLDGPVGTPQSWPNGI